MVDDHDDFPRWPLDHGGGKVGGLPLLNFPEISMWGRSPWGGYGFNPLYVDCIDVVDAVDVFFFANFVFCLILGGVQN